MAAEEDRKQQRAASWTGDAANGDKRGDSVHLAHQALREDILSGRIAPGTVLSQVQLASRFQISRTPLREALRRLIAENLVMGDFNRRMRVSELNLDDFDEIYAIRIALEPIGIAATVPALDAAGQAALTAHVDVMDEAIEVLDIDRFRYEHRAFHLGLTAGAGPRITRLLEDLWDNSERYRLTYLHHDYRDTPSSATEALRLSQTDHKAILKAALSQDIEACTHELTAHLRRAAETVFEEAAPRPRLTGVTSPRHG